VARVFISYSMKDHAFVKQEIVDFLESQGIDTWFDKDEIQGAQRWEQSIRRGLEACDWFLVVLSPRSAESNWVKAEVNWAIDKREGRLIPVLMQECERLDFHLQMPMLQHIDFRRELPEARRQLLVALGVSTPAATHRRKDVAERATAAERLPTFETICPNARCGQKVSLPLGFANSRVKCPYCYQMFSVSGDPGKTESAPRIVRRETREGKGTHPEACPAAGTAPAPPHPSSGSPDPKREASNPIPETVSALRRSDRKPQSTDASGQKKSFRHSGRWVAVIGAGILLVALALGLKSLLGKDPRADGHDAVPAAAEAVADKESAAIAAADASFLKGESHFQKKEWDRAIAEYTETIKRNRKHAEAYYKRSLAYDQLGDRLHAEDDYQTAVTLKPSLKR